MYESFFGLSCRPFAATPDPACLVSVESMRNALVDLSRTIESGQGIGILTAPAGMGKTLLCRKLINELRATFKTVFLPTGNFKTSSSLLQAVLYELGHPYIRMAEQELRLELLTAVRIRCGDSPAVVLIVDEAHLLSQALLEEIRSITNVADAGQPMVRVVLSGQHQLEEMLINPSLDALNQRIRSHVTLDQLSRSESADYISGRLKWAGTHVEETFSPEAVTLITHASDGVPRCLNQLCDQSLLLAHVTHEKPVSESTVREALRELRQLPLQWNVPAEIDGIAESSTTQEFAAPSDSQPFDGMDGEEPVATSGESQSIEFGSDDSPMQSFEPGASVEFGTQAEAAQSDECYKIGLPCEFGDADNVEQIDNESPVLSFEPIGTAEPADTSEDTIDQHRPDVIELQPEIVDFVVPHGDGWDLLDRSVQSDTPNPVSDSLSSGEVEVESDYALEAEITTDEPQQTIQFFSAIGSDGSGEFEEEVVEDRYAMLDAGKPSTPNSVFENHLAPSLDAPSPVETIDALQPMLDEAAGGPANEAPSEDDSVDRSASKPASTTSLDQPSRLVADNDDNSDGIEEQIEAIVMETCDDVDQVVSHSNDSQTVADQSQSPLGSPAGREGAECEPKTGYDVVLPAVDPATAVGLDGAGWNSGEADSAANSQSTPTSPPQYQHLFSELRRRRRQV